MYKKVSKRDSYTIFAERNTKSVYTGFDIKILFARLNMEL
jgi:hypothetical protein